MAYNYMTKKFTQGFKKKSKKFKVKNVPKIFIQSIKKMATDITKSTIHSKKKGAKTGFIGRKI